MRQKKKPVTLEEAVKSLQDKKTLLAERYKTSLGKAYGDNESEQDNVTRFNVKVGKYSLRTRIRNNPWLKSGRPANKALSWLYQYVLKNPGQYRYKQNLMFSGGLFTFEYLNPKYKNTPQLEWFDKYPLVLSLGPVVTKQGIRNLGFNLHLLPPKVRIIVLCQVFELYKNLYRYQIFFKHDKPVQIKYQIILKTMKRYGADFAVRMYIPSRQKAIVVFSYTDWYKAIFIPSRGYDSIKAYKLIQLWTKHIRKLKFSTSPNVDWNTKI